MKHALVLLAEGKDKSLIRPDPVLLRSISLPYRSRHGRHLTDLGEKHFRADLLNGVLVAYPRRLCNLHCREQVEEVGQNPVAWWLRGD